MCYNKTVMNKNYIFIGIGSIIGLYAALCLVSPQLAFVMVSTVIVLGAVLLTCFFIFKQQIYGLSINFVPKELRKGTNVLMNKSMTVQYFPGERIMATDNFCEADAGKRTFTVNKKDADLNKIWFTICRNFNPGMTLGALAGHLKKYTAVEIINIDGTSGKPKSNAPKKRVVDRSVYERSPESWRPKPKVPDIADFSGLKNQSHVTTKDEEAAYTEEFLDMNAIMQKSASKVNPNTAAASELALVPGFNIAAAKKVVEYRDLNGKFNSVDEIFAIVEIKEHFIQKAKEMLTLEEQVNPQNDASVEKKSDGRLLDW